MCACRGGEGCSSFIVEEGNRNPLGFVGVEKGGSLSWLEEMLERSNLAAISFTGPAKTGDRSPRTSILPLIPGLVVLKV